jgi:copper chaperone
MQQIVPEEPRVKIEFRVEGMSCQHCTAAVTRAIHEHDAHARVQIDLAVGCVMIESNRSADTLQAAITEAGYAVVGAPVVKSVAE